ncbi:MAG: hypothetical protein ABIC19_02115, partial [Patescibacteria group bacterium]
KPAPEIAEPVKKNIRDWKDKQDWRDKHIIKPAAEIAEPVKKNIRDWKDKHKKEPAPEIAAPENEEQVKIKQKGPTNQEIANMPKFQKWCREKGIIEEGIIPSKRQASKNKEEFFRSLEQEQDAA